MDKLNMETPDLTDKHINDIGSLFPNVITETRDENGEVKRAVDFDLLRQMLSKDLVEDGDERYRLDWPGKKASLLKANTPITKTLRPCIEESSGMDGTPGKFDSENVYIEGDNFEVLKILQESYLGKVKMIYIDPPYNTGNDFIYKDDFKVSKEEYEEEFGTTDEEGGKLFKNTDTNGRFHSDWLSMMYERLIIARDFLRDDGVIFISIDDDEQANIRKLGDEVFGNSHFISVLVWEKKKKGTFLSNTITNVKEYIFVYAKDKSIFNGLIGEINYSQETYPCVNASNKREIRKIPAGIKSKYKEDDFFLKKGSTISASTMDLVLHSDLLIENGLLKNELIIEGNWRYRQELMTEYAKNDELYITQDLYLRRIVNAPREKTLKDLLARVGDDDNNSHRSIDINNLFSDGWGSNEDAEEEIRILLDQKGIMDFPKPKKLIEKLCVSIRDKNALIMDFFSGSATTAHAVSHLNSLDGGSRKSILIQLPEKTYKVVNDEKVPLDGTSGEAFKSGYKTIAEIGKERIRRAGKKILEENADKLKARKTPLDIGFRVYKTDTSNMKDVFYHPSSLKQDQLDFLESNIKEDRTPEDLLTQVVLDLGLELSLPIEKKKIKGNDVFFVQTNSLVACFDDAIDFGIIDEIAKLQPLKVVFKDASFRDDKDRINLEERFKRLSPETKIAVL